MFTSIGLIESSAGFLPFAFLKAPAPTVTSVSPSVGRGTGGTSVTITGTYFAPGAVAKLGATNCTSTTFVNATTLTCVTPSNATIEVVDVQVTNTGGGKSTLASAFSFIGAPILWLSASSGVTESAGAVSSWADKSSTGNNATQGGGAQPTYVASSAAFNNRPVLTFNGSQWLGLSDVTVFNNAIGATWFVTASAATVTCGSPQLFFYYSVNSGSGGRIKSQLCSSSSDVGTPAGVGPVVLAGRRLDADTQQKITGGPITANTAFQATGVVNYNAATASLRVNRAASSSAATFLTAGNSASSNSNLGRIGGEPADPLTGSIAEVVVFNRALTLAEIQVIENYLKDFYNLP